MDIWCYIQAAVILKMLIEKMQATLSVEVTHFEGEMRDWGKAKMALKAKSYRSVELIECTEP